MITEKELRKINGLIAKRKKMTALLDSFRNQFVWARIGIIEINGASADSPRLSENAGFFHKEMGATEDRLTELVIAELKSQLKMVNNEIDKYIGEAGHGE